MYCILMNHLQPIEVCSTLRSDTIFTQFCLDVPRIKLVMDGIHDVHLTPTCMYAMFVNLFTNASTGIWFAHWCTQTALADVYIQKLQNIHSLVRCESKRYHLLDAGRQIVHVESQPRNHKSACHEDGRMKIVKPFRLCLLDDEGVPQPIKHYHLYIDVIAFRESPTLGVYMVHWQTVYVPLQRALSLDVPPHEDDEQDEDWTFISSSWK